MAKMTIPAMPKQYAASYRNFSGVDFSSERRQVAPSRASFSRNMYKRYEDGYTEFVETRPGLSFVNAFNAPIYGAWRVDVGTDRYIVHAGANLYELNSMDDPEPRVLYTGMAECRSAAQVFDKKLYIMDGTQYLVYDGTTVSIVEGTVPTTSIGRTPAGGGTSYQSVNMLTPLRKNSFRSDGESTAYHLDAKNIMKDSVTVWIGGEKNDGYGVNYEEGIVNFDKPPEEAVGGDDNVVIQFGVEVENRLLGCDRALLFDNRLFFAGNPNFPNVLWHSELNDPAYVSDVNYYKVGDSNSAITGMAVQDGALVVLKDAQTGSVWVYTPSIDAELGRMYSAAESVISVPCVGAATSFRDDLVYLSRYGVEGITYPSYVNTKRAVRHRSTLIDRKLHVEDLYDVSVAEWRGYLCLLFGDHMYLADSNATYNAGGGFEYEWFYWDGWGDGCLTWCFGDDLYIGLESGSVFRFAGDNDNGNPIQSEWVTRAETGGTNAMYKTAKENGAIVLCKAIPNSRFSVSVATDTESEEEILSFVSSGFSFVGLDFNNLSFATATDNVVNLPFNKKKWQWMTIRFHSTSRFGICSCEYLYTVGNFIK